MATRRQQGDGAAIAVVAVVGVVGALGFFAFKRYLAEARAQGVNNQRQRLAAIGMATSEPKCDNSKYGGG